jgi:hypothetical protein
VAVATAVVTAAAAATDSETRFSYSFFDVLTDPSLAKSGGGGYDSYGGGGGYGGGDRMSNLGGGLSKPKWDMNSLIKFEKNFYL